MRQGDWFQPYFFVFEEALYEVKASGLQLSFNIFRYFVGESANSFSTTFCV